MPLVEFDELEPGDLFTLGNSTVVYVKKNDGEYIVVQPGDSKCWNVGDLVVGRERLVRPVRLVLCQHHTQHEGGKFQGLGPFLRRRNA